MRLISKYAFVATIVIMLCISVLFYRYLKRGILYNKYMTREAYAYTIIPYHVEYYGLKDSINTVALSNSIFNILGVDFRSKDDSFNIMLNEDQRLIEISGTKFSMECYFSDYDWREQYYAPVHDITYENYYYRSVCEIADDLAYKYKLIYGCAPSGLADIDILSINQKARAWDFNAATFMPWREWLRKNESNISKYQD